MRKECEDHFRASNYKLILQSEVPEGATLLSSVQQMKRKRKPSTGEVSKYKARMNVNGKQQIKGIHYEETYAPVVGWATIRFFMSLAIINNLLKCPDPPVDQAERGDKFQAVGLLTNKTSQ